MTKIRPASTVILLRISKDANANIFQMYTIKRPETMRFLPGYTAFPGGAIEPQDQMSDWQNYLYNNVNTYALLPECPDYPNRELSESGMTVTNYETAYVIAAIREIFEETGILICLPELNGTMGNQAPIQQVLLQDYRQAILAKEITFFDMIQSLNIHLNAGKLLYIGRRLTPPTKPIRFDTNFYVTVVSTDVISIPSKNEIAADAWLEPARALELLEHREILCARPTIECFNALNNLADPIALLKQLVG